MTTDPITPRDSDAAVREARSEIERLRGVLECDRSCVASSLNALRQAIASRRWLTEEGRGAYAWDDERYKGEFGAAIIDLAKAIEPLAKIAADWSDCPTDPGEIKRLRSAIARIAALEAVAQAARKAGQTGSITLDLYDALRRLDAAPADPHGEARRDGDDP